MFNGEMSCRPRSQHPAPGPGYQIQTSAWAPPPGPEGAGLRNTGPFPGRLPARPDPGPRGSPWLPKPEPGHSQSHPRAGGGGRLNIKIMLTTDVKNNQPSLAPPPGPCWLQEHREARRGQGALQGTLSYDTAPAEFAQTPLREETWWPLCGVAPESPFQSCWPPSGSNMRKFPIISKSMEKRGRRLLRK